MAKVVAKIGGLVSKAPGLVKKAQPGFQSFIKYAKVELTPPTFSDMPKVSQGFVSVTNSIKTGKWKTLTVKEGFLNSVVALEIMCWFFIGEIIGKGSLIGYNIPGAFQA
ncbi:ATP synthase subunit g, mitochondrial [Octopus bimaculoides]|uniref:ATP synthase subunit g n=1 Tax=Octopus bimaculoides TaxID=37653 RepID=A0A0L8FQ66_OCTBM|nr:ATP synthase subunit g, mitochondrial [Octopus bimaculoides]|eukprot:XP_014787869.1 PREDICTED: ATP synthase subunit g, mitochondrial-like [Octopus bimaculoides]